MPQQIRPDAVRAALAQLGWDQRRLAEELGVSAQAVTNWMKGADFPRPPTLLRLATKLSLSFDKLVARDEANQPIIAFRRRAATKTTEEHISRARAMGELLKPLVRYLPARQSLRITISDTSPAQVQSTATAIRARLGIGHEAVLSYESLIAEFAANDAIIVPVMWGMKKVHENALHILLRAEGVTFVYLNLDTYLEDFKFWMAHELAHVYTPQLAGDDKGEDFADDLAGALLFPSDLARKAYAAAQGKPTSASMIAALLQFARDHSISLFTVYNEVVKYAKSAGLSPLRLKDKEVHAARNSQGTRGQLVSDSLFEPIPPDASTYVASAGNTFRSSFFTALKAMLRERGTGAGYVQQILAVPLADAQSIYHELTR